MNAIVQIPQLYQDQDLAFTFSAPADPDAELLVTGFSASERLNGLTQIHIELASPNNALDLHALLDTPATLTIHHKYEGLRHLSGVVSEIARGNEGHHRTSYSLTLLPSLHRMAHGSDCRIFQKKSVPEIAKILLKEHGVEDVKWNLTEPHEAREYCVQYRESHLGFLDRITAEEGIWYFFTYGANGQHTLHFIDNPQIVSELPDQPSLEYNSTVGGAVKGVYCNSFVLREQLRATSFMQRDYTFKNPPYNQQHAHQRGEDNGSAGDYALYEYPGRYKADGVGKPFTKHRLEAARVEATTGQGATNAIHLIAGHQFALTDHPNGQYNIKYHLLAVSHQGSQPQAVGEEAGAGATTYSAGFEVMPARLPYRPKLSAKPLVDGPQIAHVTGPEGEEIYCDEHGRVKVWFPWDRHGKKNDTSSCWIRVASNWAGASWGHIAIPRIGHEVIVDFLEGDPDQPIITGRTYHNNNRTPNKLPDFKTRMVLKSDSHKADGYNELRFEDEGGQEEVWFHAQKFHNGVVENNETWKVGANRHKRVDGSQSESIGGSKDIEVDGDHREQVKGSEHTQVDGSTLRHVKINDFLKVVGDKVTHVVRSAATLIDENWRLETKGKQHFETGTTHYINAGDAVVVQAGASISLNVGGNFIRIDQGGVQIEGSLVKVNCGGSPPKGSPVDPMEVVKPDVYSGPHAERYSRSYEN
ncbi:type VI secretion system secreted protein VgrG [Pseudovibrio denitrificans]|uniref:Type VI secretion system secreted protein VgrG n=1 Tax=Pseudovibrio denitrificans TaxID=258256 RepID=A0A1I6YJB8_9HYPH|nr:type VI secretion system tip protein TssI/VgrG [Pseudovibrio denitrificans]SFT50492.1 type VI secretion system secreted protein VgrG [Pseudovibrio denitrificans]